MIQVEEIMTRHPVTLGPNDSLDKAARLMNSHRIRHIPIVGAATEFLGLITQRDLLATSGGAGKYQLKDVMRRKVRTTSEHESLRAAALLMQKHKIGSLPVLRGDKLVGIITDTDYVAVAITLIEQLEETELEEMEFDEPDPDHYAED
ncbi:MAG: CBS domain-containing protein [Pseudomonadales bacterium]